MKQSKAKIPLWKNGLKYSFILYFISLFFLGDKVSMLWFPDYVLGFLVATLLFIASFALGATAVVSKKIADRAAKKSNPGPSDSDPSLT